MEIESTLRIAGRRFIRVGILWVPGFFAFFACSLFPLFAIMVDAFKLSEGCVASVEFETSLTVPARR